MLQKKLIFTFVVAAVLILALIAGWYYSPSKNAISQNGTSTGATATERPLKTYYDGRYGIAFNFPDNYEVKEHDATGAGTKHHAIVIADKDALAQVPDASEGPPSITIDIFANPANSGVEKWIKGTSQSNYKLSPDGVMSSIQIAGEDAIAYAWDGLYRSTSIVFNYKKQIYMISVGQNSPNDQIVKDFAKVVASIQLDP